MFNDDLITIITISNYNYTTRLNNTHDVNSFKSNLCKVYNSY